MNTDKTDWGGADMMKLRMNPEIKKKWVEWLRDPAHKQGSSCLKQENHEPDNELQYCCLGGLTEIYLEAHGEEWLEHGDPCSEEISLECVGEYAYLPKVVADWAGLTAPNDGGLAVVSKTHSTSQTEGHDIKVYWTPPEDLHNQIPTEGEYYLSELNDSHCDFHEIAGLIEEQL